MESSINYFKPNLNTARYNSYAKSRSTIFFELDKRSGIINLLVGAVKIEISELKELTFL